MTSRGRAGVRRLLAAACAAAGLAGCSAEEAGSPDAGAAHHSAAQPSASQPGTSQPSASQPGTSQPSTSQPSTPQPSTPQPSTPQPSTPQQSASPPRTVSLLMSGDVLLHSGTWETAQADATRRGEQGLDFGPMFADVAPVVEDADLAVCHLETPLAPRGGPFSSYPVFNAPPQVVPALAQTGYDACTTASNHTLDQGYAGLVRTLDTLDAVGMPHEGAARSEAERRRPLVLRVDATHGRAVRVALLSYTYGTNGLPLPAGRPWSVPLIDPERIVADAAAARRAGADVVVTALHFGTEYVTAPDAYQVDVVDEITRSPDIDLVYGHHAHTVQPVDRVNGTWVAYGLGNFVAQQETSRPYTYRGVTVRFVLAERPSGRFEVADVGYLPTMITGYDAVDPRMRVLDVLAALRDPATPDVLRPELRAALADVRSSVLAMNAGTVDRDVGVHLLAPRTPRPAG